MNKTECSNRFLGYRIKFVDSNNWMRTNESYITHGSSIHEWDLSTKNKSTIYSREELNCIIPWLVRGSFEIVDAWSES